MCYYNNMKTFQKHFFLSAVCVLLLLPLVFIAAEETEWDISLLDTARDADYLSDVDKDIILELNKVRTDPSRYADEYIAPRKASYFGRTYRVAGQIDLRTNEGVTAVNECITALRRAAPREILLPSMALSAAAADHMNDQSGTGRTGHTGGDGSDLRERIERYGDRGSRIGENISYGPADAREVLIQLLVDDGVRSRGHRKNIMNKDFRYVGSAFGSHAKYSYMCVMDLAGMITDLQNTAAAD